MKTRTPAQQKKHDTKVALNLAHQNGIKGGKGLLPFNKRKVRREHEREIGHISKPIPRKPAPILVTFFLDKVKTRIDFKLNKVVDPHGTSFSFQSVPVVMIRDIRSKQVKHGKRMVTEEHFTQWRPFHGALPVRDQDNTSEGSQFTGVQAPMDAWAKAGLLDGMIIRDLPREERKPFVPVDHGNKAKEAA